MNEDQQAGEILGAINRMLQVMPEWGYTVGRTLGYNATIYQFGIIHPDGIGVEYRWLPQESRTCSTLIEALRFITAQLYPHFRERTAINELAEPKGPIAES